MARRILSWNIPQFTLIPSVLDELCKHWFVNAPAISEVEIKTLHFVKSSAGCLSAAGYFYKICKLRPASQNCFCFNEIILKSAEDKISLKTALEISPNYLLKGKNKKTTSKIRIVADACFR